MRHVQCILYMYIHMYNTVRCVVLCTVQCRCIGTYMYTYMFVHVCGSYWSLSTHSLLLVSGLWIFLSFSRQYWCDQSKYNQHCEKCPPMNLKGDYLNVCMWNTCESVYVCVCVYMFVCTASVVCVQLHVCMCTFVCVHACDTVWAVIAVRVCVCMCELVFGVILYLQVQRFREQVDSP